MVTETKTKRCWMCKQYKSLDEFFNSNIFSDGKDQKCKSCTRLIHRKTDMLPHRIVKSKHWLHSEHGKERLKQLEVEDKLKNPEKYKAHQILFQAIKNGLLQLQPCEACGNPKSEGHHPDYSKPLEVRWLCRKHHAQLHRLP